GNIALADPCQIRNVPLRHLVPYADVLDYGRGPMSLILVPQVSGSVLPANVHQRVVYKKPQRFIIYIPALTAPCTSDHSRSTASASSSEPAACAALSSARSACAFAAFSPS